MKIAAQKSSLSGTVTIPGSKSHTIRAIAIASLADGESFIQKPLYSSDTQSAVECYRTLGAKINTDNPQRWAIKGTVGRPEFRKETIDVGNSGTTLRLGIGSAALAPSDKSITFTGDKQICKRPIEPLLRSINDLGAVAESIAGNGSAPLRIQGRLTGGKTAIECITSQYLSSLLLAAPLASDDTQIEVTLLNEPDYVQITIDWLTKQGIRFDQDALRSFRIPGGQKYKPFDEMIPADFSSATFFLCAGAILDADVTISNLDFDDSQPDKAVLNYLGEMGANITVSDEGLTIASSDLKGIDIDMNKTPDALPAMAVTAAFAEGTTRLLNVPQARKKETDRIACMSAELQKLGARTEELPDGLVIHGPADLKPATLHGHDDHRIVMALSLAAMALPGQTTIDTAQAISVTFPDYVKLMQQLGANIEMTAESTP